MIVRLYQRKDKVRADGKAPIYYVLALGRTRKLIATEKYVSPKCFDNTTGKVTRGEDSMIKTNAFLGRQVTKLNDIIMDLVNEGHEPTFENVEKRFLNDNNDEFISFALEALEKERGLLSHETYRDYKGRLSNVRKFRGAIPIKSINHNWLVMLRNELILSGRSPNGCNHEFATIKKFYRIAVMNGKARGNPFENFKLERREETVKAWLTKSELTKLRNILDEDKITDAEKNTLRHFLFSCFTGLRFGDKKAFNKKNIVDGRIQLRQSKTGKNVNIPFNDQAVELLPFVLNRNLKQSGSRVNTDLKECMVAAKIDKHITYHCSRHTFAINCIMSGVDILTVRDWLGHASVTTTEIYAKIAAEYKDESMQKMDSFYLTEEQEKQEQQREKRKLVFDLPIQA